VGLKALRILSSITLCGQSAVQIANVKYKELLLIFVNGSRNLMTTIFPISKGNWEMLQLLSNGI